MSIPTIEDLGRTYDEAQHQAHVAHEPGNVTGHHAGIEAVRDAVLEAVAREADAWTAYFSEHRYDDPNIKWREAFDKECMFRDASDWIRSLKGGGS